MTENGRHMWNLLLEGKYCGSLQYPAAKNSDKSTGNLAGSKTIPGTATLETLGCYSPVNRALVPDLVTQAKEGWKDGSTSQAPSRCFTETITHTFSQSGRNWENWKTELVYLLLKVNGQGGSELVSQDPSSSPPGHHPS